jgi:spore maturation protein CgeB
MMSDSTVICAAAKYAYNDKSRGVSYEFDTVFRSLKSVYADAAFIDVYQKNGCQALIDHIDSLPDKPRPRLLYIPYRGILSPTMLNKIRKKAEVGIFHLDDTWRQDIVSAYDSYCDWFTTSDPKHHWRYTGKLTKKVQFLPFGFDFTATKAANRPFSERDINISFVGARNDYRSFVISTLAKKGIEVACYGSGWPNGSVTSSEFNDIIGRSKISLNLSNSVHWDLRYLTQNPLSILRNFKSGKTIEQFKARHLEIAALGACQLSFYCLGIENILKIGDEVIIFPNIDEIPYMLKSLSDEEAATIAARAEKAVVDYSYQKQFKSLF